MQDRAIAAIGQIQRESSIFTEPYEFFVEDLFPGKESYYMLFAVFRVSEKNGETSVQFEQADLDRANAETCRPYLYRKGSPRGGDITFTTKAGDLNKKLKAWRSQIPKAYQLAQQLDLGADAVLLGALQACVEAQFEAIKAALLERMDEMDKKLQQETGFSVQFLIDGKKKHLGDFEVFRRQILAAGVEGKKEKYNVVSAGTDRVCSICLEQKPEVLGFASPFKYATVDKPGTVAGFFDQRSNWKNYPICPDCALAFELGQKFVVQELKKYFYGLSFYLVPKPVIGSDRASLERAIGRLKDIDYQLSVKEGAKIQRTEKRLMRMLGESENAFSLTLLFFEENQTTKAINIKLMLEEILPSRFRRLFIEAPERIENHPWYHQAITVKKEKHDLTFSFGLIKEFFEDQFYELIQKVFRGERLALEDLWSHIMAVIRRNQAEGRTSYFAVLKAHLLIRYFAELGIIDVNTSSPHIPMETTSPDAKAKKRSFDRAELEAFISSNPRFFDEDYKKGIFAVGILVRLLLNIQYRAMNGRTPFEKKLKGFNLNHEALMSIYMETLDKLSQFKYGESNFFIQIFRDLRDFITEYYVLQTPQTKRLSNNELSFYFVAGLEMGNKFKLDLAEVEADDATLNN